MSKIEILNYIFLGIVIVMSMSITFVALFNVLMRELGFLPFFRKKEEFTLTTRKSGSLKKNKKKYRDNTSYPKQTDIKIGMIPAAGCAFMTACKAMKHSLDKIQSIANTLGPEWFNNASRPCYMDEEPYKLTLGGWPLEAQSYFSGILGKDEVVDFLNDSPNGEYRLEVSTKYLTGSSDTYHYWLLSKNDSGYEFYNPDDEIKSEDFIAIRRLV